MNDDPLNPPPPPVDSSIQPVSLDDINRIVSSDKNYMPDERTALMRLKDIEIRVGKNVYYTLHELAILFRVPAYYWRREIRNPNSNLFGQEVAKQEIIDGESFHKYILAGKLNNYKPRKRKRSLEEDLAISEKFVESREELDKQDLNI
jgi:hypothetical protein